MLNKFKELSNSQKGQILGVFFVIILGVSTTAVLVSNRQKSIKYQLKASSDTPDSQCSLIFDVQDEPVSNLTCDPTCYYSLGQCNPGSRTGYSCQRADSHCSSTCNTATGEWCYAFCANSAGGVNPSPTPVLVLSPTITPAIVLFLTPTPTQTLTLAPTQTPRQIITPSIAMTLTPTQAPILSITPIIGPHCDSSCGPCGWWENGICSAKWGNSACCHMMCVSSACKYVSTPGVWDCKNCP